MYCVKLENVNKEFGLLMAAPHYYLMFTDTQLLPSINMYLTLILNFKLRQCQVECQGIT